MQNFKDGKIPVADNKLSSLMNLSKRELAGIYEKNELDTISFWLIEHFTGVKQKDYLMNPDVNVNQSSIIHFCNAVEKLKAGTPVQYVIGEVEFYGLKLRVNNSVLIPRPETEELVDLIVKENKDRTTLHFLDIGTGSGCIALGIVSRCRNASSVAVDASRSALETAKDNASMNGITDVNFVEMNVLTESNFGENQFDLIVSNPPYIAASESKTMAKNVLEHEPEMALFVSDDNALIFYQKIVELCEKYLKPKGPVYLEINERLGKETARLFNKELFSSVQILKDMFGKNRFIKAVRV